MILVLLGRGGNEAEQRTDSEEWEPGSITEPVQVCCGPAALSRVRGSGLMQQMLISPRAQVSGLRSAALIYQLFTRSTCKLVQQQQRSIAGVNAPNAR